MKKQRSRSWISIATTAGTSPRETGTKIQDNTQAETSRQVLMTLAGHSGGQPRVDRGQPRTQHPDPEVSSVTGMNKEVWSASGEENTVEELSAGRRETGPVGSQSSAASVISRNVGVRLFRLSKVETKTKVPAHSGFVWVPLGGSRELGVFCSLNRQWLYCHLFCSTFRYCFCWKKKKTFLSYVHLLLTFSYINGTTDVIYAGWHKSKCRLEDLWTWWEQSFLFVFQKTTRFISYLFLSPRCSTKKLMIHS